MLSSQWIREGAPCWLTTGDPAVPFRSGEVVSSDPYSDRAKVRAGGQQLSLDFSKLIQGSRSFENYPDMDQMPVLNEPQILNNLLQRYKKGLIYSAIGSTTIVLNPFSQIQALYCTETRLKYLAGDATPHIFKCLANARVQVAAQNQAIIIGGQSGSGKTENTRRGLIFLTACQKGEGGGLLQRINDLSPVLQAFGNAKTLRNDNSSRFGKFLRIYYKDGMIAGASIQKYLLQKGRVTKVPEGQCSYHIFYYFLNSLDESSAKQYMLLPGTQNYALLGSKNNPIPVSIQQARFKQIIQCFRTLGFQDSTVKAIWKIIAAVVHLNQVVFKPAQDSTLPCTILNKELFEPISMLLSVPAQSLHQKLTFLSTSFYKKPLNQTQAEGVRNAIARGLYQRVFQQIVERTGGAIRGEQQGKFIGLLDIFGFQKFENNSLEQLNINYSNQRLQLMYIQSLARQTCEEYRQQGLYHHIEHVKFPDNVQLLFAFQSMEPSRLGLFQLLTNASLLNHPDQKTVRDAVKLHSPALAPGPDKSSLIVKHTPAQVNYCLKEFNDKNADVLRKDIVDLLNSSKDPEVQSLLSFKQDGLKLISQKFKNQMLGLQEQLSRCSRCFVRCLKPNQQKLPNCFEPGTVLQQVRYLGLLQSIQFRKLIHPYKFSYPQFCSRFRAPFKVPAGPPLPTAQAILAKLSRPDILLGITKIYMRSPELNFLNQKVYEYQKTKIAMAQRILRYYRQRKAVRHILKTVKWIARLVRASRALQHADLKCVHGLFYHIFKHLAVNGWLIGWKNLLSKGLNQRVQIEILNIRRKNEIRRKMQRTIRTMLRKQWFQKYLSLLLQKQKRQKRGLSFIIQFKDKLIRNALWLIDTQPYLLTIKRVFTSHVEMLQRQQIQRIQAIRQRLTTAILKTQSSITALQTRMKTDFLTTAVDSFKDISLLKNIQSKLLQKIQLLKNQELGRIQQKWEKYQKAGLKIIINYRQYRGRKQSPKVLKKLKATSKVITRINALEKSLKSAGVRNIRQKRKAVPFQPNGFFWFNVAFLLVNILLFKINTM